MRQLLSLALPTVMAMYLPFCPLEIRQTTDPPAAPPSSLWVAPADLPARDVFNGPWGVEHAPNPQAEYTLVHRKHSGVNPGMTVLDSAGREWSVKQAPSEGPDEGPAEVTLSRVLSAVGFHQPPVYYLRSFTLRDDWGTRIEQGGRFRLKLNALKDRGEWAWQQNPFVGTKPYQGLLVILLMFNNSDVKNANNTLYEYRTAKSRQRWYVVRDLGGSLGTTGRLAPRKNDVAAFERYPFVLGVRAGYVDFHYEGWHQEIFHERITADDLEWAADLLAGLSDRQWRDAFRAGGYSPAVAARFIRALEHKVAVGQRRGLMDWTPYGPAEAGHYREGS